MAKLIQRKGKRAVEPFRTSRLIVKRASQGCYAVGGLTFAATLTAILADKLTAMGSLVLFLCSFVAVLIGVAADAFQSDLRLRDDDDDSD